MARVSLAGCYLTGKGVEKNVRETHRLIQAAQGQGKTVQVDPIKRMLKAPGTKRLKRKT